MVRMSPDPDAFAESVGVDPSPEEVLQYQEMVDTSRSSAPLDEDGGIAAAALTDEDLLRQLASLHRTRHDTMRHGSDDAWTHHQDRSDALEAEYLRRFPEREIDPARLP
jgi:hypothetical protein